MDKPDPVFEFDPADQEALGFRRFFEAAVLPPRAIAVMGEHNRRFIGIEFVHPKEHKRQERLYRRRFGEREIPVLSIIHPAARSKTVLFERENERIG